LEKEINRTVTVEEVIPLILEELQALFGFETLKK
jgi:hypothetical protein